jgi:hypothetical protein
MTCFPIRRRVTFAWAFLGLAAALSVVAAVTYGGGQRSARACRAGAERLDNPVSVTKRFLLGAVERRNLGDAYNIVTPGFRQNESCSEWLAHPKPSNAFPIDWDRTSYKLNPAGGAGQAIYDVILYRPGLPRAFHYLIELRTDEGNAWPGDGHSWRVAGW